jgi:hypothetical protein
VIRQDHVTDPRNLATSRLHRTNLDLRTFRSSYKFSAVAASVRKPV